MLFLYDNSSGPQISQPYRSTSLTGASNNLFYIEIVTVLLFASKRSIAASTLYAFLPRTSLA